MMNVNRVLSLILLSNISFGNVLCQFYPYPFLDSIINSKAHWGVKCTQFVNIGEYVEAKNIYELDPEVRNEDNQYIFSEDFYVNDDLESTLTNQIVSNNFEIIIINESHNTSIHRSFLKKYLHVFKKLGFNKLAIEALPFNISKTELKSRVLHTNGLSNSYASDPQFMNLIEQALDLGIQVVGYEYNPHKKADRDIHQALNIYNKFLKDSIGSKIIIFCGYAHARKTIAEPAFNQGRHIWLAKYLQSLTGKKVLSINQETFTQRFKFKNHPLYDHLKQKYKNCGIIMKGSNLFQQDTVISFDKIDTTFAHEIYIYHPPLEIVNNRAKFLFDFMCDNEQIVNIDVSKYLANQYPLQIQAFETFGQNIVPYDHVEISSPNLIKPLMLKQRVNYSIKIVDSNNKVEQYKINVK